MELRARWTAGVRRRAWARLKGRLAGARVLEVGCGSGVICREVARRFGAEVTGLEADPVLLRAALERGGGPSYCLGRAHNLPFPPASFDVALCHLLLLWLPDPVAALREMVRVVRPGGLVAALAEPDLGARVDHPDAGYALWMRQALLARGGHPDAGRRLAEWFVAAGLRPRLRATAVLFTPRQLRQSWHGEWEMLERELGPVLDRQALAQARERDRRALDQGWRTLVQVVFTAHALRRPQDSPSSP
jgi:SAM-dependent methyltransferase